MKPKKQGQEQAMFNYLDANAKKIIKNVDVLSLILGSLVEDFKEMDEGQLKAYLAPIQNNVKNFSPQVQMQSTELFIGKNKCILDTLFAFNKGKQGALLVDIEMQSTNDYYMELRNVQYCTAVLAQSRFKKNRMDKLFVIWINMAPPHKDEGIIMVSAQARFDPQHQKYVKRRGLRKCPTSIIVNLYDIRKPRIDAIKSEKLDLIAVLSTIFSVTIDYKEKDAILKARGFHYDEKMRKEMENMESWSRYIFNSMKPMMLEDAKKEVREQAWAEGMAEGMAEGREKGRKVGLKEGRAEGRKEGYDVGVEEMSEIYVSFANGKSDEEVLEAFPKLTLAKVKKQRQKFEKLKIKLNRG